MICADLRNYGTLAHEVFHVIENVTITKAASDKKIDVTHYPYIKPFFKADPLDTVNLMINGNQGRRDNPQTVTDSVRLTGDQRTTANKRDTLVKNP